MRNMSSNFPPGPPKAAIPRPVYPKRPLYSSPRLAFRPALGLARRDALWAIKALRDEPLPLFAAAAARESDVVPEIVEPTVALRR